MEFSTKRNRVIALIVSLVLLASFIFSACGDTHTPSPPHEPPPNTVVYSEINQAIVRLAAERLFDRLMEIEGASDFFEGLEDILEARILDSFKSAEITDGELTSIISAFKEAMEKGNEEEEEEEIAEEDEAEEESEEENEKEREVSKLTVLGEIFENAGVSRKKLIGFIYHFIRAFDDILDIAVFAETITKREAVSMFAARDSVDKKMINALIDATNEENDHTRVIVKGKILYAAINAEGGLTNEDLEKKIQRLVLKHDIEISVDAEDMVKAMHNWAEYVSGFEYGEEVDEIAFDSIFVKFIRDIKTAVRNADENGKEAESVEETGEEHAGQMSEQLSKEIEDWKEYPAVHMPRG